MIVFPAIDLRRGQVVRLRQGDPQAATTYSDDPVATALRWQEEGASWIHVVNLDGALGDAETSRNLDQLTSIKKACQLPIQFGGGLRSLDNIEDVLARGATRIILGTVAVQQPELVEEAVKRYGAERIVIGVDARDGLVAVSGWKDVTQLTPTDVALHMRGFGIQHLLFTDIGRDMMLAGVNVEATAELATATGMWVIASGGVASLEDMRRLKAVASSGIEGVIIGQALYTGRLRLADAIAVAKLESEERS